MCECLTGLGAEGLHQCEGLRATVWEVATGQPHLGGWDLHRSCTAAGGFLSCVWKNMRRKGSVIFFLSVLMCVVVFFSFLPSADFWDLFGPKFSEWHWSSEGELVRKLNFCCSYFFLRDSWILIQKAHFPLLIMLVIKSSNLWIT